MGGDFMKWTVSIEGLPMEDEKKRTFGTKIILLLLTWVVGLLLKDGRAL
jgi:hypothetical protein